MRGNIHRMDINKFSLLVPLPEDEEDDEEWDVDV